MNTDARQRLRDALKAAEHTSEHVAGKSLEYFLADYWFRSAVERQLEIIGEALNAARRLEPRLADIVPQLHEWVALRNVISHQYDKVQLEMIWDAVTLESELVQLINALRSLLAEDDHSGNE